MADAEQGGDMVGGPSPGDRLRSWRPGGFTIGVVLVSLVALGVRWMIPPAVCWQSGFDDESQMRAAHALLQGRWLGSYDDQVVPHLVLAKAAGYPLFLAAIHPLGIAPPVAALVVYLCGAILLVLRFRRTLGDRSAAALYAALALAPHLYQFEFSRVYRDQLTAALAVLAVGISSWLGASIRRNVQIPGARRQWVTTGLTTLCLGLVIGYGLITRPDSFWVWPLVATTVVAGVGGPRGVWRTRRWWTTLGACLAVVAVAAGAVPAGLAMRNQQVYGVRLADDYTAGQFPRAVRLWSSVRTPSVDAFSVVSEAQRAAVYAVSPTARQVESQLEGPNPWRGLVCGERPDGAPPCADFGTMFAWALRQAAVDSGAVHDPASLQAYFGRLADEIDAACRSGRLTCGREGLSADVPAIDTVSLRSFGEITGQLLASGLTFDDDLTEHQSVPLDKPATVALWESTVVGADTTASLEAQGFIPRTVSMSGAAALIRAPFAAVAATLMGLLVLMTILGLALRRPLGWLALASAVGWAANAMPIALIWAAGNRVYGKSTVTIYTMPGQGLLVLSCALTAVIVSEEVCDRRPRRKLEGASRTVDRPAEHPGGAPGHDGSRG